MAVDTVDITDCKETGAELAEIIHQAVKDTQRVIIQDLPFMLRMTSAQFEMLKNDPDYSPQEMNGIAIWITPDNVMEIHISDAPEVKGIVLPTGGKIITEL